MWVARLLVKHLDIIAKEARRAQQYVHSAVYLFDTSFARFRETHAKDWSFLDTGNLLHTNTALLK